MREREKEVKEINTYFENLFQKLIFKQKEIMWYFINNTKIFQKSTNYSILIKCLVINNISKLM